MTTKKNPLYSGVVLPRSCAVDTQREGGIVGALAPSSDTGDGPRVSPSCYVIFIVSKGLEQN